MYTVINGGNMEPKVNEVTEINGKNYRCEKGDLCEGCAFFHGDDEKGMYCEIFLTTEIVCNGEFRKDFTSVIFKEVV